MLDDFIAAISMCADEDDMKNEILDAVNILVQEDEDFRYQIRDILGCEE